MYVDYRNNDYYRFFSHKNSYTSLILGRGYATLPTLKVRAYALACATTNVLVSIISLTIKHLKRLVLLSFRHVHLHSLV